MSMFTIICTVTATVREEWKIEAESPEEAQRLFEEAPDGQQAAFVGQTVVGDEEDRTVERVEEVFVHTPATCPTKHWNRGDDVCADCGEHLS